MGWKQYAETVETELKQARTIVTSLRHQLAECEEHFASHTTSTSSYLLSPASGLLDQIAAKEHTIEGLSRDVVLAQEQVFNGLKKSEQMERDSVQQTVKLERQVEELTSQLSEKTSERTTSVREIELSEQVNTAKKEIQSLNVELRIAKETSEKLSKQLQAEKASNVREYSFMRSNSDKIRGDGDDDEPLPTPPSTPASGSCASSTPNGFTGIAKKQFRYPKNSYGTLSADGLLNTPAKKAFQHPKYSSPNLGNSILHTSTLKKVFQHAKLSPAATVKPSVEVKSKSAPSKKRKLSEEEELALEVADLAPFEEPRGRRTKPRNYTLPNPDEADLDEPSLFVQPLRTEPNRHPSPTNLDGNTLPFDFTAICTYSPTGEIASSYTVDDLRDCAADLWNRIKTCVVNIWTKHKGEDWQWEFQQPSFKPKGAVCVSAKCSGKGRTAWHRGEEGKFACRDCVRDGRPCFAFVLKEWAGEGEDRGEFWLLPLRGRDREVEVRKGFETRYWINDGVCDVESESDGEYVDG